MKYIYPRKIFRFALLVVTALCCVTCEPDIDVSSSAHVTVGPADLTTRTTASIVSGFVTDENENPVSSASVGIGTTTTSTDQYGYFEVRNISVVQNAATVTVSKQNYFKAVKTFTAEQGKGKFFRIKLMPKTQAGTINAAIGGTVTLSGGLVISIPANAVVNAATTASYSGSVNVYARLISATDPDLDRIMPGDLRGLTSGNSLRILTTYGMAAIELNGAGGELLQIAAGKKATLTIPIPASLQSSSTSSIPLWYFNESNGLWMEEGSATRSGNVYIAEVSHFSFWNCDQPGPVVQFNCTLVTQNAQPLRFALVKLTRIINPIDSRFAYTDSAGYVSGPVPANEQLLMEVFTAGDCSTALYSQIFTTTSSNLSLGTITINSALIANINGTVTSCNNTPVNFGRIILIRGSQYYCYPVNNGIYNFNIPLCSSPTTVSIIAQDFTNLQQTQQSLPTNYVLYSGNSSLPNFQACGATVAPEFIYYSLNGTPYYYAIGYVFHHTLVTISSVLCDMFQGSDPPMIMPPAQIIIAHPNVLPISSTPLIHFTLFGGGSTSIPNPITVQITEYGNIGQYIAGNFTGVVNSVPGNISYNVICSFRIKRAF